MCKIPTLIFLFILSVIITDAQIIIKKIPLTKDDKSKGILLKYAYLPKGVYHVGTTLVLYKSGRYEYNERDGGQGFYSFGKWKINHKILTLNSDLQQNEVPIQTKYLIDSSVDKIRRFSEVQDPKRHTWVYAYVLVNNDSTLCNPSLFYCKGSYTKMDSVKILFGDRMSSKWIKVEDKPFQKLQFTLDTDEDVKAYIPMNKKQFGFKGDSISINWKPLPPLLSIPVYRW